MEHWQTTATQSSVFWRLLSLVNIFIYFSLEKFVLNNFALFFPSITAQKNYCPNLYCTNLMILSFCMLSDVYCSVTQSYANSFWGNVVLDTFNNVSGNEDNILNHMYKRQTCPDFYYDDFWFSKNYTKMHINIGLAIKPNFMSSFLYRAVFL